MIHVTIFLIIWTAISLHKFSSPMSSVDYIYTPDMKRETDFVSER